MEMEACIEKLVPGLIAGWAFEARYIDEPVIMSLLCDGNVVAETRADQFRADLKQNGVGDGCHGFTFAEVPIPELPVAFLAGRLRVIAQGQATAIDAWSADYLRPQVEHLLRAEPLETLTLQEFLDTLPALWEAKSGDAGAQLEIMNAARAHYPDWRQSEKFVRTGLQLARITGSSHSQRFYRAVLADKLLAAVDDDASSGPAVTAAFTASYGTFEEWSNSSVASSVDLITPRWFSAWNPQSFLEEVGILTQGSDREPRVPVLALREFAFADSTWWVKRCGIPSRVLRTLYYLDFETLRSVLDQGGMLVLDMSNEGSAPEPEWIAVLNDGLRDLDVNPAQVILVTQNLQFAAGARRHGYLGSVATAHFYISKSLQVLKERLPTETHLSDHCSQILRRREGLPAESLKHYICLNFTPRWQRWATVLHLSLLGLLDKGFVSFPGGTNFKQTHEVELPKVMPQVTNRYELLKHIPAFISRCPLTLDFEGPAASSPDFIYPIEQMGASLFHIVTESEMSDGTQQRRITEKILKPIIGLQPFVVVGNPGSLALMRDMGFRTFGALIDESYDSIADPARRMDALFEQIDMLVSQPIEELRTRVAALNETLIFNFLHLMTMGPMLFNGAVRNRLLRLIEANAPILKA
jgi:hypothetical protein